MRIFGIFLLIFVLLSGCSQKTEVKEKKPWDKIVKELEETITLEEPDSVKYQRIQKIFDGKDNKGSMVDDGIYTFELEALDEEGFVVPYDTYLVGEVTGVTYYSGSPYLMIGNKLLAPENVIEVTKNES